MCLQAQLARSSPQQSAKAALGLSALVIGRPITRGQPPRQSPQPAPSPGLDHPRQRHWDECLASPRQTVRVLRPQCRGLKEEHTQPPVPAVADSCANADPFGDGLGDGEFPLQPLLLPAGEHRHRRQGGGQVDQHVRPLPAQQPGLP